MDIKEIGVEDNKKDNDKGKRILTLALSFMIPFILIIIAYREKGIYPGGKLTVLTYDLEVAGISGLAALRYLFGTGDSSLFFQTLGGLGGNQVGNLAFGMGGPLVLLTLLFPLENLPDAIYWMEVGKIGLTGLAMSAYLLHLKYEKKYYSAIVLISVCYAMSSYNVVYAMNVCWADIVLLLPLLLIGVDHLVDGKKGLLFLVCLTLALYWNYYLAYMAGIFIALYLLFRMAEKWDPAYGVRWVLERMGKCLGLTVLSLGLSMPLLLPALMDLRRGKMAYVAEEAGKLIRVDFLTVLRSMLPGQAYTFDMYAMPPHLYCGMALVILAILGLIGMKHNKPAFWVALGIMVLFFLSFWLEPLDKIWHAFRTPHGHPGRYTFTFSCFLGVLGYRGIQTLGEWFKKRPDLCFACIALLFVYTIPEIYMSASVDLSYLHQNDAFGSYNEYEATIRQTKALLEDIPEDEFTRVLNVRPYTLSDGLLYGYNGISYYSASFNLRFMNFMRQMGACAATLAVIDEGISPVLGGLLGAEYLISNRTNDNIYELVSYDKMFLLARNPYALSLGYLIPEMAGTEKALGADKFVNQNIFLSDVLGEDVEVFYPLEVELLRVDAQGENVEEIVDAGKIREVAKENVAEETDLSAREDHYRFLVPEHEMEDSVWVGWEDALLKESQGNDFIGVRPAVFENLGIVEMGEEVNIDRSEDFAYGIPLIYALDVSAYKDCFTKMQSRKLQLDTHQNGCFTGTIDAEFDGNLLITFPYEEGYQIRVDGQATSYGSYRDALLTIPVSAGMHTIEIKFIPRGIYSGAVLGLISLIISVLLFFRKGTRQEQKFK